MIVHSQDDIDYLVHLFYTQVFPDTFPNEEEFSHMDDQDLSLEEYKALPQREKKKWILSANPLDPRIISSIKNEETGIYSYRVHFFFEPATPDILERIY